MNSRVCAVVPAYNEAATIGAVVQALIASPFVDDVVVVSDGSTDDTAAIARRVGALVVELPTKSGKGNAIVRGAHETTAPILLFCDADLRGFSPKHVEALLQPVVSGARAMNVGLRDRGYLVSRIAPHLPLLSGERAMLRSVFERVPSKFMKGYMIESALNYYCRSERLPYGSVLLRGVSIRRKFEKVGWPRAIWQYLKMSIQVLRAMIRVRIARSMGVF